MYAKVIDNIVVEIMVKPDWIQASTGEAVSDTYLIQTEGIYPIIDTLPTYNERTQTITRNDLSSWTVNENSVEATYTISNKPIEDIKESMINEVHIARYTKLYSSNIPYTFPGDSEPSGVQMRDEVDRQNLQDLYGGALGFIIDGDPGHSMSFKTTDNIVKALTASQVKSFGQHLKTRGDTIIAYSWVLKAQIRNATTIGELEAIVIDPDNFIVE